MTKVYESARIYKETHKEQIRAKAREWWKKNKDRYKGKYADRIKAYKHSEQGKEVNRLSRLSRLRCKEHDIAYNAEYHEKNKERINKEKREYFKNAGKEVLRRSMKKHDLATAARLYIASLKSRGLLIVPKLCEACSAEANLNAHHEDYLLPAVITWLCRPCHVARHKQIRKLGLNLHSSSGVTNLKEED